MSEAPQAVVFGTCSHKDDGNVSIRLAHLTEHLAKMSSLGGSSG